MAYALNKHPMMVHAMTPSPPFDGLIKSDLLKEVGAYGNAFSSLYRIITVTCYNHLATGSTSPPGTIKVNGLSTPTKEHYFTKQEINGFSTIVRAAALHNNPSTRRSYMLLLPPF
jgi:hypothetical protein